MPGLQRRHGVAPDRAPGRVERDLRQLRRARRPARRSRSGCPARSPRPGTRRRGRPRRTSSPCRSRRRRAALRNRSRAPSAAATRSAPSSLRPFGADLDQVCSPAVEKAGSTSEVSRARFAQRAIVLRHDAGDRRSRSTASSGTAARRKSAVNRTPNSSAERRRAVVTRHVSPVRGAARGRREKAEFRVGVADVDREQQR